MPAHNLSLQDPQTVLRILLVLIEANEKHELRFKCADYDRMERGKLLVVDFDKEHSEVVIRATSDYGAVVQVTPEAHQWTQPAELAPRERARAIVEERTEHRSRMNDEQLAELEERLGRERQVSEDIQEGKIPLRINVRQ